MTNTANPTTHCIRCGRALRSAESVARGYGPTCASRIASAALASTDKSAAIAKATELIELRGVIRIHRGRAIQAVSSDGTRTYLATQHTCNCPAGLVGRKCYHQVAASLVISAPVADRPAIAIPTQRTDPFAMFRDEWAESIDAAFAA
jgi:hypothetical protein